MGERSKDSHIIQNTEQHNVRSRSESKLGESKHDDFMVECVLNSGQPGGITDVDNTKKSNSPFQRPELQDDMNISRLASAGNSKANRTTRSSSIRTMGGVETMAGAADEGGSGELRWPQPQLGLIPIPTEPTRG